MNIYKCLIKINNGVVYEKQILSVDDQENVFGKFNTHFKDECVSSKIQTEFLPHLFNRMLGQQQDAVVWIEFKDFQTKH